MIPRDISGKALSLWRQYPVLTITGPRQSGKTTLAKSAFSEAEYINLEALDIREEARNDPRGFLSRHPAPLVLDEIQNAPDLLSYLQVMVDESGKNSQYVLTGSHQPALQSTVSQSLAGRTGMLELLPFSIPELVRAGIRKNRDEWIFHGFLPRLYGETDAPDPTDLFRDYFRTYVERDVRQIANLRRLESFETFIRLLAGRVGQLFNAESLAGDVGVSAVTIREWLAVLEACYLVFPLRPYYRNFGKRFTKAPKIYFTDPGLASHLLGIRDPEQIASHPLVGNLFENLVVCEALKARLNAGRMADLWFLRTSNGVEADLVAENGSSLDLYEVKSSSTYHTDMGANLRRLTTILPVVGRRTVIYAGREAATADGTSVVPFERTGECISGNDCR